MLEGPERTHSATESCALPVIDNGSGPSLDLFVWTGERARFKPGSDEGGARRRPGLSKRTKVDRPFLPAYLTAWPHPAVQNMPRLAQ